MSYERLQVLDGWHGHVLVEVGVAEGIQNALLCHDLVVSYLGIVFREGPSSWDRSVGLQDQFRHASRE